MANTDIIRSTALQAAALIGPQLEDIKEGLRGVSQKIDSMDTRLTEHLIADSGTKAATKGEVNGLGHRLNEHIADHAKWRPLWFGVILAAVGAAFKVVFDMFGKNR